MSAAAVRLTHPRVRDALLTQAERIPLVPLTLVVAPAGSGKSTLLAAWQRTLAAQAQPTAYLDLSPLHADAAVLVSDLRERIADSVAGFGDHTLAALAVPAADDAWRALARAWLRDLAAVETPLVLFLDNFHELPAGGSGARWLDELLRARSSRCVLVVSSRGSVPAAAARLRSDGALIELGANDLSLRFDEVSKLLAAHGVQGDPELAARLLARTEGWATGVQLAARRLAQMDPASRAEYVQRLSREPDLFGFVAAEVLRDEPEETIAAVEAVALLGRCAPSDVAELLGDARALAWIARAVERGLVLVEGDEIRVHQLWRDLIAARAAARSGPEAQRERELRAGELLRRHRRYDAALDCLAHSERWEPFARTLLEATESWPAAGRGERLAHWLARMPRALVDTTPALLALRGFAAMRPAPQLAIPDLERAMELYRARGDVTQERAIAGTLATAYLSQLRRDDALRVLRRLITLRGVLTDPAERGALYVMLGVRRYLTGRYAGALAMSRRAAAMPIPPVIDFFNVQLFAWIQTARGGLDAPLAELDRLLARPGIDRFPFAASLVRLHRARVHAARGDARRTLEDAELADAALRDHRMPLVRELTALLIAHGHARLGDAPAARAWYDEALRRTEERGGHAEGPARAQLAVQLLRWGEDAEAAREASRALDALGRGGDRWTSILPWIGAYAIWALARGGDVARARTLVRRHARAFAIPDLPLMHHTVSLVLADVARAAGETQEAERHARAAFESAARAGLRSVDQILGDLVTPPWAEWAIRADVCSDYALGRLAATRPERIAPLLAELARDRNAATRERAVRLLALRGDRASYEPLRAASEDRAVRVRDAARAALAAVDLRPGFALRVRSLGAFEVSRGEAPVRGDDWKGQTARRLFARLLVAEGRAVARERLREDLWPDADPDAGRNNLRVAATRLNDALDPDRPTGLAPHFVVADGETLALRADAIESWDAERFRTRLRDADEAERGGDDAGALAATREALALYGGPLLSELDEAWLVPLRREFSERFAAAAHRVAPRLLRRGRADEALDLAARLLREDPADERAFALRMRVALARGDRGGALRSYQEAVAVLRRELEIAPGAELEQLAAQARTAS